MAYINKEDFLATINEVWERGYAKCERKTSYDLYRMCIRRINRAQVADVQEIVRCKDCIHRDPEDKKCDCSFQAKGGMFPMDDNDFCSYGESR